ncbi:SDR family NAD(P)-dependent oxidoreductase [Streptomyces sp. LRE541]|uniref:SDR family NAD(P)-dependent oxidoreductase n=1 Tax=Streptomyces sp. LRE541 TaxID=2931983 RepID=UPI00200DE106|nr:SDR family NAD(P)-dependent oxidoreductase [Streptomyces sp. LRE541]UPZ33897.1 SDR family NAD(P)-dependent oxidoreductase [Streptomyces sp. LRE541]
MSTTEQSDGLVVIVTGVDSGIGRAIAVELARAGHHVYAGVRDLDGRNTQRVQALREFAAAENVHLTPLELDVLSEPGCRSAIDVVLGDHGRIDVVVNNAGMLMAGVAEGFTPEQFLQILDTNAVSWLRVNRAVLPVMRRQGSGTLVYISSTSAHIAETFMATYIAGKAAGEFLAESMGLEVAPLGISTVIVVPGAFTEGTEHFAHSNPPADTAVVAQYGSLPDRAAQIPERLSAIDLANDGSAAQVETVGRALVEVLGKPRSEHPRRFVVDAQRKGVEEVDAVRAARQSDFFRQLGIDDLLTVAVPATTEEKK